MAFTKTDAFDGDGHYRLELYTNVSSQSVSGNYSDVYWRIRVINNGGPWYWATTNMGNSGWADSSKSGNPDLWNNPNMAYDFREGTVWTFASGTVRIGHSSDGNGAYWINTAMTLYGVGYARVDSGTITLPRLYSAPPAPKPLGLDLHTQTSMRYRFQSTGDGGESVDQWQIGYGTSSSTPQKFWTSSGTSTVTGLAPATTYYFWSRGRNSAGWGPWSSRLSGRTVSGANIRVGGKWKEAVPYIKVNGVWRLAQPYIRVNGVWKPTD